MLPIQLARLPRPNNVSKPVQSRQVRFGEQGQPPETFSPLPGLSPQALQTAIFHLETILSGTRPLLPQDAQWLNALNPGPTSASTGLNGLSVSELQQQPKRLAWLERSLRTMLAATNYQPSQFPLRQGALNAHNPWIARYLRPAYTPETFAQLFAFAKSQQVFNLGVDPRDGLMQTTQVSTEENKPMTWYWVSDLIQCAPLIKAKSPQLWQTTLNTLATFYNHPRERDLFRRIIAQPALYYSDDRTVGVAHVFSKDTKGKPREWYGNKRLESHGLALKAFCENLIDGLAYRRPWGTTSAANVSEETIQAISNLAAYLARIAYWAAPSMGCWEEHTFKQPLTWDTEAIRSGFEKLDQLLFDDRLDNAPGIRAVRQRLLRTSPGNTVYGNRQYLQTVIRQGQERVRRFYLAEAPGQRELDASLAMIPTSTIRLDDNPYQDILKHLQIIDRLRPLVRENGMIRYLPASITLSNGANVMLPDSYLNLNYDLAIDKTGQINLNRNADLEKLDQGQGYDAGHPDLLYLRARQALPGQEAQWFMVSILSEGAGKQLQKLLHLTGGKTPSAFEMGLIKRLFDLETEYLNRAFARITGSQPNGKPWLKANGYPCPAFSVPEAYQAVSTLKTSTNALNSQSRFMPGTNTPLAWASVSLYQAALLYQENLWLLQQRGLLSALVV